MVTSSHWSYLTLLDTRLLILNHILISDMMCMNGLFQVLISPFIRMLGKTLPSLQFSVKMMLMEKVDCVLMVRNISSSAVAFFICFGVVINGTDYPDHMKKESRVNPPTIVYLALL